MFEINPTWDSFIDVVKEHYYPMGNYDDQYTKWTILRQERDQTMSKYTNKFHTLHTKLGIKDSEWHTILKYHSGLHWYIRTQMDILVIASLGSPYRYAVKIKEKFW